MHRDNDFELLNPRQQKQAEDTAELAVEFGMFDQTTGANGAHYAPAAANPFKAEGLMCGNCVFFDETNSQCVVVSGDIEAEAVCKLWVIPETYLKTRSDVAELERRDLRELRFDAESGTISGIAVPYGETVNVGGYKERFAPGAITDITDTKLFYGHEEPIGKVISGRDTKQGFEITAKVSNTPRGNEVLTLMRDGVLNKFSVGFVPLQSERDGDTVVRTSVSLREVSVVAFPAYPGASISEVREESEPQEEKEITRMSENIAFDVAAVRDEMAELRRSFEASLNVAPVAKAPQFRSYGEFVKAYALGDDAAVELASLERAATTSADAALRPAFLGTVDGLIAANRTTANLFVTAALPATGLTVEWAKVTSNTIATGKQSPENTALTDGNIVFSTLSSSVATYGSQTSMSRQTIERSTVPFLDTAFRAMAIGYAKKTNADVVATLAGLTFTAGNGRLIDISTSVTAATLAGAIADGASYIYQNAGMTPEFLLVDPQAYKKIVTLSDQSGRPLVLANAAGQGTNNIGSANIPTLQGSIFNVPIYVDPALAANTVYLGNSQAVVSYESSGTPTRLQLEDPGTLTNKYAIYGYGVFSTVPFDAALVKIKVA